MVLRFTEADVNRVSNILDSRYGSVIVDTETFLRAYDFYAKDSYIARIGDYIPTEEDSTYLDGSEPNNFCANVWGKISRKSNLKFDTYLNQELRETAEFQKNATRTDIIEGTDTSIKETGIAREYADAEKVKLAKMKRAEFKFFGKQKGSIVAYRKIDTKAGVRNIDRYGRYVSVKL